MYANARYLFFLSGLGVLAWFVHARRSDLSRLPFYLKQVEPDTIAVLAALEILFLTLAAQSNRLVYRSLGVRHSLFDQLQLLLAAETIERLLPSGGAAGMSSFVWLARRCGIAVSDSIKMTATTFVLGYAQIVPLLLIPLFVLDSVPLPNQAPLLIGLAAGCVAFVLGVAAVSGSESVIRRLQNRPLLSRYPRLLSAVESTHAYTRWSWQNRRDLLFPLLLLWGLYPVRVAMLWICFAAFHSTVSLPLIWTGYSIAILLSFLTFLPTTLGVFELSMVGTFALLGVPTELAAAVTLLYRGFTYWLPIPFGLLAWWNLRRKAVE